MSARSLAALLLLLGPGCHSYLLPFDERPVIAPLPVATQGGQRLDLDERGDLVLRPPPGDVAAALGVGLHEAEGELVVTHRLRADAPLEPGDRLLHVAAAHPPPGGLVQAAFEDALAATFDREDDLVGRLIRELEEQERGASDGRPEEGPADDGGLDGFDPVTLPGSGEATGRAVPSPEELRARPDAHPVSGLGDLRGYLVAARWAALDLLVERDGVERVVRAPLVEEAEWLPVRLYQPERFRWHGVDLVRTGDLPRDQRPVTAEGADDLLVVRVARDAPAARAGLRPLDVVPALEDGGLLEGEATVRAPDGAEKRLSFSPREVATELWIPLFLTWQSDGTRTHVGAGPFDIHGHYSSQLEYVPTTDSYREVFRWSFGTSIQGAGTRSEAGTTEHYGINILDAVRFEYFAEWLDAAGEAEERTGAAP